MIDIAKLSPGRKYDYVCDKFRVCGTYHTRQNGNIEIAKATVYLTQSDDVDYVCHDVLVLDERVIREINVSVKVPKERIANDAADEDEI